MLFQKDQLLVRIAETDDVSHLVRWLSDERVLYFYGGRDQSFDEERVRATYLTPPSETMLRCIVEWEGTPIGYIQMYRLDTDTLRKYGYPSDVGVWRMDQFIGEPDYWNRGIGTCLVQAGVEYLVAEKGAEIIAMEPQVRNSRAIRCYEKCGFHKAQLLPRHEKHEGSWQHCWLMEYDRKDWE